MCGIFFGYIFVYIKTAIWDSSQFSFSVERGTLNGLHCVSEKRFEWNCIGNIYNVVSIYLKKILKLAINMEKNF